MLPILETVGSLAGKISDKALTNLMNLITTLSGKLTAKSADVLNRFLKVLDAEGSINRFASTNMKMTDLNSLLQQFQKLTVEDLISLLGPIAMQSIGEGEDKAEKKRKQESKDKLIDSIVKIFDDPAKQIAARYVLESGAKRRN